MIILPQEIDSCLDGTAANPHQWLGLNSLGEGRGWVVRAMDTDAQKVIFVDETKRSQHTMTKIHSNGFFELELPDFKCPTKYRFRSQNQTGQREWIDPYSFSPFVTNEALRAFNEGWERKPYEKLGSIPSVHEEVDGVSFVVWAPSAKSVHLVGDFNHWNPVTLPMRSLGSSGCRELFVPSAKVGDKYKFRILGFDGICREKTDPFALSFEPPSGNSSIVCNRSYEDSSVTVKSRKLNPRTSPISIYEMHLGSWKHNDKEGRPFTYRELSRTLPSYLEEMGFSHVEFLPPSEYPYGASWGYQVTGYYAPTNRYGTPDEFALLVDSIKEVGVGVIIDWVPAHFPADDFSLSRFDGTCLFEHEDPRQGKHAEWGTLCYNYGRAEVRSFLIGSAVYWLDRFGIDGYRVDAVASMLYLDYGRRHGEWIPNEKGGNHNLEAIEFLQQFNHAIHQEFPNVISIAEESTAFPMITQPPEIGGLGFDFKWNMGWMHDILNYFSAPPYERSQLHENLTFGAIYQFSENFIQAFSHDEVVHGKGSLANKMNQASESDRLANLRSLISLQWTWPGKNTLFMGSEFGQWKEWNFETSLDWGLLNFRQHAGIRKLVADLNRLYLDHPTWAYSDHLADKFQWIDCNDVDGQTLSFLKFGTHPKDTLLVACNFSDRLCQRDWGCPHEGSWEVVLDSDARVYGGEGSAGDTEFLTFSEPKHKQPCCLSFSVGRWSVRILRLKNDS